MTLNPAINTQNLAAAGTVAGVPGDGSNATALASLAQTLGIDPAYANRNPDDTFTQIVSDFGTALQNATSSQQQAASSLQSLNTLKSSVTGVSLDNELANLIQNQDLGQSDAGG